VAWSDGEVAPEERRLLEVLARRYFMADVGLPDAADAVAEMVSGAMGVELIDELAPRFTSHDDKQLALKLSYMVIRVGRNLGDTSSINEREKQAYRRLVEGLGLPQGEVEEAEWAAVLAVPDTRQRAKVSSRESKMTSTERRQIAAKYKADLAAAGALADEAAAEEAVADAFWSCFD
jgi:hypothetical protein